MLRLQKAGSSHYKKGAKAEGKKISGHIESMKQKHAGRKLTEVVQGILCHKKLIEQQDIHVLRIQV